MKSLNILFSLNILLLCLCQPIFGRTVSDRVDNRNFAIDIYYPTPNEIRLAERRAQRYGERYDCEVLMRTDLETRMRSATCVSDD